MATPVSPQQEPHHEPIEVIHFNETFGRPVHHYILWSLVVLALLGGAGWMLRDRIFPKPPAEPAVPLPPATLEVAVVPGPDSVVITSQLKMAMVESKATVHTFSGAKYFVSLDRIEPGGSVTLTWDRFRSRDGWALDLKKESPTSVTFESFGKVVEVPVQPAAPAEPAAKP